MPLEPISILCPHCNDTHHIAEELLAEFHALISLPFATVVLMCPTCVGVFLYNGGNPRVIQPDEWQEMPETLRDDVYERTKRFKEFKARLN